MSGIKCHIDVDSQGLPHFIAVTTADVTDRHGALAGMENYAQALGGRTQLRLAWQVPALVEKLRKTPELKLAHGKPGFLEIAVG